MDKEITVQKLWNEGKTYLSACGIENSSWEAGVLLEKTLHADRAQLLLSCRDTAEKEAAEEYRSLLKIRGERIPLQHILGKTDFMGLSLAVNENVLCPRQDTETLAEEVLKYTENKAVLDMCTGSGCIALSLAVLGNPSRVVASDKSREALSVARKNGEICRNGMNVPVEFTESDLFENITGKFDVIVSNPPYIESSVIETLMPEVRDHEPRMALDGREDGLYFYRKITEKAPQFLTENGMLFYEIGYNQAEAVSRILREHGFQDIRVLKDLSGNDRVAAGMLKPAENTSVGGQGRKQYV